MSTEEPTVLDDTQKSPEEIVPLTPEEEAADAPAKQTYEEKLANAKDDTERFAISNAEAAKNRRLLAKAQKKVAAPAIAAPKPTNEQPSQALDVDERILQANGMPDELLSQLKDVAALRKVGLIEAQKDPLFVAAKGEFEKTEKSRAASMPPSRGSGSYKAPKTLSTPGLTKEEHKALVRGS